MSELRETLALRGREVDALQVEVAKGHRKWYQEPTILVSALALAASLLATLMAQSSSSADREFERRARLTTLIQQISDARLRTAELEAQYGSRVPDPDIVQLGLPLAEEAAVLVGVVYSKPFEKVVIADALVETNQPYRAEPIAEQAELEATSLLEKVITARARASSYFAQGKAEDGRRAYLRALEAVDTTDASVDSLIRTIYQFDTEERWALGELRINNCSGAKEHIEKLGFYADRSPKASADFFESRAQSLHDHVIGVCP